LSFEGGCEPGAQRRVGGSLVGRDGAGGAGATCLPVQSADLAADVGLGIEPRPGDPLPAWATPANVTGVPARSSSLRTWMALPGSARAAGSGRGERVRAHRRLLPRHRFAWSSLVHEGRRVSYLTALGIPAPHSRASARRLLRALVLETARQPAPGVPAHPRRADRPGALSRLGVRPAVLSEGCRTGMGCREHQSFATGGWQLRPLS
jgi:hypothetical protein